MKPTTKIEVRIMDLPEFQRFLSELTGLTTYLRDRAEATEEEIRVLPSASQVQNRAYTDAHDRLLEILRRAVEE